MESKFITPQKIVDVCRQYTAPPTPAKPKIGSSEWGPQKAVERKVRPVPYSPPIPAPNQEQARQEFDEYVRQHSTLTENVPLMRECVRCREEIIHVDAPAYKTMCGPCYNADTTYRRPCVTCGGKKIPFDAEAWWVKCGSCRAAEDGPVGGAMRTCVRCLMMAIPLGAPDYKTICKACYKEKLGK